MGFEFKEAKTDVELAEIYGFRYNIFVEEMGLFEQSADHITRMLTDQHDEHGRNFFVKEDGRVVGVIRINWGGNSLSTEFRKTYHIDRFENLVSDKEIVVITRLAVCPEYRNGKLPLFLMQGGAAYSRSLNAFLAFCDCQPHLVRLYETFGFRSCAPIYNDPEYGIMVPMLGISVDHDHLVKKRSPLRRIFEGWESSVDIPEILDRLPANPHLKEVRGITLNRILERIESLVEVGQSACLFTGLETEKIQHLLVRSHVFTCRKGDQVIRKGSTTKTLFFILEGQVEVISDGGNPVLLKSGQCFGEISLLCSIPRTADIYSVSDSTTLLSIDEKLLLRLVKSDADLAHSFFLNLSRTLALKLLRRSEGSEP